jgi:putative phage-type endonuclease
MKKNQFLEKILVQFLNDAIIPYFESDEHLLDISVFDLINIHYKELFDKNLNEKKDWSVILKLWKIKSFIEQPIYSDEDIKSIEIILGTIDTIYQPEQRSLEWYEIRNNLLTASDLGTALNLNKYSRRKDLVFSKAHCIKPNISNSPAIIHGVKFEDVAINIYSIMNNVVVKEYGCIPHSTLTCFGASPDGICSAKSKNKNYIGRMLEIKCPKSRPITGFIPTHYELQIQGQLEVCNLEYCDFLECDFKEYNNMKEFQSDKKTKYKGAIFEYYSLSSKSNKYEYLYDCSNLDDWQENNIDMVLSNKDLELTKITYWKCVEVSIVLVKRDKKRFNSYKPIIETFWSDVLKERECPYEKKISFKTEFPKEEFEFLSDSN